mmetsp:Transcript_18941/g.31361  ORF Transcript_18941/g.31361 Transcript_18941/m.31361 type:complete len:487 (-) Transcript_18941:115-1575(-)|eukprot:CAMPEP_0119009260 /NCGR_PEP_ID=MMETSP1176-20130426/4239_1 /TAXON_ID=265551 /ORGANISM="Synedropsis recta cf, Strain CCMP1620" /LENGTH=486 /DNA_ID=CAMNT_0006961735 /DNA_START=16 /DNA_END=1476 /DNA_ORIENTATION=-
MTTEDTIEDDNGVEMFLPDAEAETNKPLILPARASMKLTAAQRRWRLLKNLKLASKRSTSLTKSEEYFLHTLKKPVNRENPVCEQDEDEALQQARKDLLARIKNKGHSLTPEEEKFLINLAESHHVTTDYLIRSAQVLLHDPLYKLEETKQEPDVPEKVKPTLRQRDASFRSEVWTHFSSSSLVVEKNTRSAHEEVKDEKKDEKRDEEPSTGKKKGFMYKFFHQRKQKTEETVGEEQEDHFDHFQENPVEFSILATHAEDKDCQPHVLSPPIMDALRVHLPLAVQQDNFWLRYSMIRDGASMRTLLQKVRSSARTVMAIETMEGDVFGAFTSSPWRPHGNGFYGSCEAFLWRMSKSRYTPCDTVEDQIALEHTLDVFSWSGKNRNVQSLVNADGQLVIGGGAPDEDLTKDGGCGLMIRPDLINGFSDPCFTFECPALPTDQKGAGDSFEIANLEVWALTPVDNLPQAEKLELGRQFIFDHGNFAQD